MLGWGTRVCGAKKGHGCKRKKQDTAELVCGVTSFSLQETIAEELLKVNRGHWAVDAAHRILDHLHAFDEDRSRIRTDHGPEIMACLCRFAPSVLKHYQKRSLQPITEQFFRLCGQFRIVLDYLKPTAHTKPRRAKNRRLTVGYLPLEHSHLTHQTDSLCCTPSGRHSRVLNLIVR